MHWLLTVLTLALVFHIRYYIRYSSDLRPSRFRVSSLTRAFLLRKLRCSRYERSVNVFNSKQNSMHSFSSDLRPLGFTISCLMHPFMLRYFRCSRFEMSVNVFNSKQDYGFVLIYMCSGNVYPLAIAAHPSEPNQFSIGLTGRCLNTSL